MIARTKEAGTSQETKRPPAKQARSRRTRERLVGAGLRLIEERDFDNISISEFAATAKASVGAFYHHFADKDDYYGAVVSQGMAEEQAKFNAVLDDSLVEHLSTPEFIELAVQTIRLSMISMRGLVRTALRRHLATGAEGIDASQWTFLRDVARGYVDQVGNQLALRLNATAEDDWTQRYYEVMQMNMSTLFYALINQPRSTSIQDQRIVAMLTEMTLRYLDIGTARDD